MSAAAQPKLNRTAAPIPRPVAVPKQPRVESFHRQSTPKQLQSKLRKSDAWQPVPVSFYPDLFRVATGKSQVAMLIMVLTHSEGTYWRKAKPKKTTSVKMFQQKDCWTEPLTPEDFAKETGLSREMMADAIEDACERNLMERKSKTGKSRYLYRLLPANWPAIKEAFDPRNVSKKEVQSASEAEPEGETQGEQEANSRGIAIPPVFVQPLEKKALGKLGTGQKVSFYNGQGNPASVTYSVAPQGDILFTLLSISSAAPASPSSSLGGRQSQPVPSGNPAPEQIASTAPLAGPGLFTAKDGWREFAAIFSDMVIPILDATQLGPQAKAIPIYLTEEFASKQLGRLKAPLSVLQECAQERIARQVKSRKPITTDLVPWCVTNANEVWKLQEGVRRDQAEYDRKQKAIEAERQARMLSQEAARGEHLRKHPEECDWCKGSGFQRWTEEGVKKEKPCDFCPTGDAKRQEASH